MTRNEIFAVAVDWLYTQGKIADQAELARKTGITETTISRILNNKVRKPSDETLRRLNEAFDNVFNHRWLRGESDQMFVSAEKEQKPNTLEDGINNLLQVAAQQIKDNEELHRELHNCVRELHEIVSKLRDVHFVKTYKEPNQDTFGVSEHK